MMNMAYSLVIEKNNQLCAIWQFYLRSNYQLKFNHIPVMLNECIDNLKINPDGIYVDGTLRRSRA